jgi:hypothetical protein
MPIFLLLAFYVYLRRAVQRWGFYRRRSGSTRRSARRPARWRCHGAAGLQHRVDRLALQPLHPQHHARSAQPDYIRTAKSKGLPRRDIVWVHALKNASLPIVTVVGLDLPLLLGGAVVTERIFAWPGMGRLFLDHVSRVDTPVVMGILMLIATAVVVFQIITDIVYAWLDPRIRYAD